MKLSFLHTADIHIGVKIKNKNFSLREKEKRRRELWETFEKIINIASSDKVNYLFIAGDLINQNYCNFKDIKRIAALFDKIKDTKVLICCGNNDAYSLGCLYEYAQWPDNVHLFKNTETFEMVEFEQDNLCVYSMSCGEKDALSKIDSVYNQKVDSDKINILLLHANLLSDKAEMYVNPDIIKYKYNYCAMGHIHGYITVADNVIYPGCPEMVGFTETNYNNGIIKGEIDLEGLKTEFIPTCKRKFIYKEIQVKSEDDFNGILDAIKSVDGNVDIMNDYVKIKLSGSVGSDIDIEEIKNEAKQFFYYIEFEDNYTCNNAPSNSMGKLGGNIIDSYIMQFESKDKSDVINEKAFELGLQALKAEEVGK